MAQTKTSSAQSVARRRTRGSAHRRKTWPDGRPMSLVEQTMDYINRNYARFIKRYPGEYIVALGNRVLAHGPDLDEVADRSIEKAGDKAMSTVLEFIPEDIEDSYTVL